MNINWKLRLQNKPTLIALCGLIISFTYNVLAALHIVPKIAQEDVTNLLLAGINILAAVGVVTDPTTKGLSDSKQALTYNRPKEG